MLPQNNKFELYLYLSQQSSDAFQATSQIDAYNTASVSVSRLYARYGYDFRILPRTETRLMQLFHSKY